MEQKEPLKVQFCIPPLNSLVVLAEEWTFNLYNEYRNQSMLQAAGGAFSWKENYGESVGTITLPKGTKLAVDRIYVRRGKTEYDSITFRIKDCPNPVFKKCRFWAKLADVNKISCFPVGSKDAAVNEVFQRANPGCRLLEV